MNNIEEVDVFTNQVIKMSVSLIVCILCLVASLTLSNPILVMASIFGTAIFSVISYYVTDNILSFLNKKNNERLNNFSFKNRMLKIKSLKNLELENAFNNANENLIKIKLYAELFSSPILKAACNRIIKSSEKIMDRIVEDPEDYKIARTWFNTILPEANSIITEMVKYEKNQTRLLAADNSSSTIESFELKMIDSLNGIADNFEKVLHSTTENDITSLNVKMDALHDFMKEHSK